jgi:hypothetical protein
VLRPIWRQIACAPLGFKDKGRTAAPDSRELVPGATRSLGFDHILKPGAFLRVILSASCVPGISGDGVGSQCG